MSQGPEPDSEAICALIVDDVIDLLGRGQAKSTVLLVYQKKWMQAGASLETCKVVRLLVASLGAPRQDQVAGPAGEVLASRIRFAMAELAAGDWDTAEDLLKSPVEGGYDTPLALIMKGGGIKGLAYVGAIDLLSKRHRFNWYVGTSAGAVTAVLLGAGFSPDELKGILKDKNFKDFFDAPWWRWPFNLIAFHGIHQADSFTDWLDTLLARKLNKVNRVRLSDLPSRVTVYASRRNKSALKFDSVENDADAAYAVRCSMSIPLVFVPQSDQGIRAYDGGLQHNYPVKELLVKHPDVQFISLYLGSEVYEPVRQRWVLSDLISIWTESGDQEALSEYRDRTVIIDPRPVGTLDFSLSDEEKEFLLLCGRVGAFAHLGQVGDEASETRRRRDELKERVQSIRNRKHHLTRYWIKFCLFMLVFLAFLLFLWKQALYVPNSTVSLQ